MCEAISVPDMELPVPEVILVASELTIMVSTYMLSHFNKLLRGFWESVSLAIKYLKGRKLFCSYLLWITIEELFNNI